MSHAGSEVSWSNLMKLGRSAAEDLRSQRARATENFNLVRDFGAALVSNGVVDDRKYLIERIIQLAALLPNDSALRQDLSGSFIKSLWNNLKHPPISYLGESFKYRMPDGSNNNIMYPQLGAAGNHYARTVTGTSLHSYILPDPELVFDVLLRREGPAREHPTKVSSHLFYFATIIIHDIFRTDETDSTKLKSSSYLDLGPLYGHDESQQKTVRTFQDGLLKKDTFAEYRLLAQPPGVAALLVAFNRFHNYIVRELATINENDRFSLPADTSSNYKDAQLKRDNDLFQTGRLITCGLYVNIILGDYLRTILNLNDNPTDSDWKLDPREAFNNVFDPEGTPKGIGNQVSVEFNFVYRWHATVSNRDEAWLDDFMNKIFRKEVNHDKLKPEELIKTSKEWFHTQVSKDPGQWVFGDLERQEDGSFLDADLVGMLNKATETVAGAFGARNTPVALKAIEILGIQQGRQWGLASLNEFRAFFKFKPFSTFAEINSSPEIAEALEALYGHPDNVELYPGLMAEEAKEEVSPGSGLCPGFTISEAILSDAVALVRGDRFYSVEYGPQSLTSFGFQEVSSDYDIAGGGVMYKLLMRAFPGCYLPNSVYALYPFSTPSRTRDIFTKNGGTPHGIELDYKTPTFVQPPIPISSWQGVANILGDQDHFKVPWGLHISQLTGQGHDYMLSGDAPSNSKQRVEAKEAMYRPVDTLDEIRVFFETVTEDLIRKNKRKLGSSFQIDIVQDIGNSAYALFTTEFFGIPFNKSPDGESGNGGEKVVYDTLAHLFQYVFLDTDPAKSYKSRVVAARETQQLAVPVRRLLEKVKGGPGWLGFFRKGKSSSMPAFGQKLVSRLLEKGKSVEDVLWELIPTAAGAAATQAQAWAQVIDLYMSDKYHHHWAEIEKLARSNAAEDFSKLKKYILEGFRLSPAAAGILRVSPGPTNISDGSHNIAIPANSILFVNFITAGRDPSKFPDPETIRLDRPEADYIHFGWGPHNCLGGPIAVTSVTAMVRAFARNCQGVRRAPGGAGEMKRKMYNGAFPVYLAEDAASWEAYPVAKKVLFESPMKHNSRSTASLTNSR